MQRFFNKPSRRKLIRPISSHKIVRTPEIKSVEPVENEIKTNVKEMVDIDKLKTIAGTEETKPAKKVKRTKKQTGLYERSEENSVILTEDDKMLLND